MFGGINVQRHPTIERVARELNDRTIPTERQAIHSLVSQIAQCFGLLQGDAKPDEHFNLACSDILRRQTRESQILAIQSCDRKRILMFVFRARQKLGQIGRAVREVAEANRSVA